MSASTQPQRILFITVGVGNPNKLEESLYTPISRSIGDGDWTTVVLLPSQGSLEYARELKRRHAQLDVHIRPLRDDKSENDAHACYDHFQQVIAEFRSSSPDHMTVDITRGTKAMSAALMLAAFRHHITSIRYVEGDRDPEQPNVVIPGTERVRDVQADAAVTHRILDEAHRLFAYGDFAAAAHLLQSIARSDMVKNLSRLADFYAAWDRLDYTTADETPRTAEVPESWKQFVPSDEARDWVHRLAQSLPDLNHSEYMSKMAIRLRLLIVDLLANGERRLRHQQFEDAVIRAYRVVEMIGQARLFDQGLDSARLPSDHPQVISLQRDLQKKQSAGFDANKDGSLKAPREFVARLLKRLGDPLASDLLKIADGQPFRLKDRNHSILIHGFSAVGPSDSQPLQSLYDQVRQLANSDNPEAKGLLAIARAPDFTRCLPYA